MKRKRVMSLFLVTIMVLVSLTMAFAAPYDLVHKTDPSKNYTFSEFTDSPAVFDEVSADFENYLIEAEDGKLYEVAAVQAALDAGAEDFNAAIAGLSPYEPEEEPPDGPDEPDIPVQGKYKIVLSAKDISLIGDGYTNTTIEVELVDEATGEREPINNLQVRLTTTYGQLSDSLVTLQNGYGHTTLNSEHVLRRTDVDLDAQVIEATVPVAYKENITGMTAKLGLIFETPGGWTLQDFPKLKEAESNQADRVTLFFDRNVDPAEFNSNISTATVWQNDGRGYRAVRGFFRLEGNDPHSLEVILEKDDYLTDNKTVYVNLSLTRGVYTVTSNTIEFILTDNRKPQVTAIEHDGNMRTLKVYFSEAMYDAKFVLNGGTNLVNGYSFGDLEGGKDNRHIATLNVEYLAPGIHKLQISGQKDFAWLTDPLENLGTTQELEFTVLPDPNTPTAIVDVESPEQYRIYLKNATLTDDASLQDIKLQIWDIHEQNPHNGWKEIKLVKSVNRYGFPNYLDNPYPDHATENYKGKMWLGLTGKKLAWVEGYKNSTDSTGQYDQLVVETNTDWTWVFDTEETGNNYYDFNKFRLVIPAGTFVNVANNLKNEEIILPIVLPIDDESPKLRNIDPIDVDWGEFNLLFDEPVKGIDIEEDEVGETPSQKQYADSRGLPNIVVQYRGTNSAGKPVTIDGYAENYVSKYGKDDEIRVTATEDLRDLVDYSCYGEDWTLVVMNVTDDIGNAAETVTRGFTIRAAGAPSRVFQIDEDRTGIIDPFDLVDGEDVNLPEDIDLEDYDVVRVEYTDLIRLTGSDDSAIDKSNYKLNGRDLGEDSFILVDLKSYVDERYQGLCRYEYEGYYAVYIFTPEGSTLYTVTQYNGEYPIGDEDMPLSSNTLEVNERLYSKPFSWSPGVKLIKPYEIELGWTDPLELIPITGVEVTRGSDLLSSDTYYATVRPTGASVYYQWQKAIQIPDGSGWFDWEDVGSGFSIYINSGKNIKVRVIVTGRNNYTGTKYSNEVERIATIDY